MRRRRFDKAGALGQFKINCLPGLALFDEVLAPALEPVGPRLDRVAPASDAVRPEARHPAVVVVKREGRFLPRLFLEGVIEDGPELVVAVAEQIGPDLDGVARNALCGISTGVDFGIDVLDGDARIQSPRGMMSRLAAGLAWPDRHLPDRPQRGTQYLDLERHHSQLCRGWLRLAARADLLQEQSGAEITEPRSGQQFFRHELVRVMVLRIDQRQGALGAGFALPQQRDDRVIRP